MRAMEATQETLRQALTALRAGDHVRAATLSDTVLRGEPGHFGARHLRGIVALMTGDADAAIEHLQHAVAIEPSMAPAHYNLGNALAAKARHADAVASFDRALGLNEAMAEAWCNRGNALVALGEIDGAARSFQEAIRHRPQLADAHVNLGDLLFRRRDLREALQCFESACRAAPERALPWINRAKVLTALHEPQSALASAGEALRRAPQDALAWATRAAVLVALGQAADACADLRRAIDLAPEDAGYRIALADALRQTRDFSAAEDVLEQARNAGGESTEWLDARGVLLHDSGRHAAARAAFEKALDQAPDAQSVLRHLGNLWQDLNEPEQALERLDRALALDPEDVIALNGRGLVHTETRDFQAAAADYERVLVMRPDSAEAHKRRAILRLLQGDYPNGWADYETSLRLSRSGAAGALQDVPYWQGEALAGKRILLSEPNGLGDTLQFIRLVSLLRQRGAEVAFLGPARMLRLLRTFPPAVNWLSEVEEHEFDYQSELWSLPHWLGLTLENIPARVPYLSAEPERVERWAGWLAEQPGEFRVGVCWQGNPARKIDVARSVPLRMLEPLAAVPGVQLVSLQTQHGLDQLDDLPDGMTVIRPPADFDAGADAFLDSAALMQSLDLVITIDSALTHLAGALGRPVWLALRSVPEFRWMLDRADSPWYPTVRLFRQQRLGHWAPVYQAMAAALQEAVSQARESRADW